jgi:S1-C subfamily serine protease
MLLVFAVLSRPARADEILDAERSVVRIVVITFDGSGEPVGIGHGSGFAIAADRVVTNAHVFQSAAGKRTLLFVVVGNSKAAIKARPIHVDRSSDLALLQIEGTLPPLLIYGGQLAEGANVFALGFPGNVDLATASSLEDYLAPKDAIRTQGNLANRRKISGIDAVLHTAAIARGNSGGPLLDQCGRVLGVNSFTTNSGNGDAAFGFAISNQELLQFLKSARQSFAELATPCLSPAERLAAEQAAAAQERERIEFDRRAQEQADLQAQQHSSELAQYEAENWVAAAIILGVLGLAGMGAGGLLFTKDRVRSATGVTTAGLLLVVAGTGVFFSRPGIGEASKAQGGDAVQAENGTGNELNSVDPAGANLTSENAANSYSEETADVVAAVPETSPTREEDVDEVGSEPWISDDQEVDFNEGL